MYTLGIDVHKDESHVVVLDDTDEIHDEVRVLMIKITFGSRETSRTTFLRS